MSNEKGKRKGLSITSNKNDAKKLYSITWQMSKGPVNQEKTYSCCAKHVSNAKYAKHGKLVMIDYFKPHRYRPIFS